MSSKLSGCVKLAPFQNPTCGVGIFNQKPRVSAYVVGQSKLLICALLGPNDGVVLSSKKGSSSNHSTLMKNILQKTNDSEMYQSLTHKQLEAVV
jgi:hypothetical protein